MFIQCSLGQVRPEDIIICPSKEKKAFWGSCDPDREKEGIEKVAVVMKWRVRKVRKVRV